MRRPDRNRLVVVFFFMVVLPGKVICGGVVDHEDRGLFVRARHGVVLMCKTDATAPTIGMLYYCIVFHQPARPGVARPPHGAPIMSRPAGQRHVMDRGSRPR